MNQLIFVDFTKRCIVPTLAETFTPVTRSKPLPDQPDSNDMFSMYDYHIKGIEARLGDKHEGPFVYKQRFTSKGFDTYGYGCAHNSIHQWMPKDKSQRNNPFPMPADLRAIDKFLCDYENEGNTLKVGLKSDPFMWMDQKYGMTKSVLRLATKYGVKLNLYSMSDLCGYDDYIELIKAGGHSIVMQMGFDHLKFQNSSELDRQTCPGAPSKPRRQNAVDKLKLAGIDVEVSYTDLRVLIKDPSKLQRLCRATGTGPDYWTGADALTTAGVNP